MGWIRDNRHWVLLGGFVVSLLGVISVLGIGAFVVLGAVLSANVTSVLGALLVGLRASIPFLIVALVLGVIGVTLLGGAVVTGASRALSVVGDRGRATTSKFENERVAAIFDSLERRNYWLSRLGLAAFFEPTPPTPAEQREQIKSQYVEGEISEAEFERRMQDVLENERSAANVSRTRRESADRETTIDIE